MITALNDLKAKASDVQNAYLTAPCEEKIYTKLGPEFRSDRIPSTTPGAEPPRDAKDSGSARSHSTHLETSSSNQP